MSIFPRKTIPERYAACCALRLPSRRGAGVAPPSGETFWLRTLHTSTPTAAHTAGSVEMNGQPSWTMSLDSFHDPMFAFRSRNSAGVICPAFSASSPYWTPTLSHGERAKPVSSSP